MRFDTVFLDAGGTLVWPNWERIADTLRAHGIDVEARTLAAADPLVRRSLDEHHLVAAAVDQRRGVNYFESILTRAGVLLDARAQRALSSLKEYQKRSNLWECVPAFVIPALTTLRQQGYRLVVVSNANGTVRQAFQRIGLAEFVDLIIDSAEEGFEKPDPRLFEVALRRSGASASKTLHAGDIYHIDIVGARAAGLTSVLIDEANLYPDADCQRLASVAELPRFLDERFSD